jgi:septal ring factor EnvC (AmiA/AmiB activator)
MWSTENFRNFQNNLNDLEKQYAKIEKEKQTLIEQNISLMKVLATVKNDLERTTKNPSNLLDVICRSIDSIREVTPYYSADLGSNKIDPPLSDEEKENFKKKLESK